jgi:hypothetical protein
MSMRNKKSKKPRTNFAELILSGLIDLIVSVTAALIIKHIT